jgi:hypothetical protein
MLDLKPKPRTGAAPAKGWRNYYRVYRVLDIFPLGTLFPGIHGGPDVFPSKEIADEKALRFVEMVNPPGRWFVDHAGAYPEGERAN